MKGGGGVRGMFGGMGKNVGFCGYPFYKLESRKQKSVPESSVSHYWGVVDSY